MNNKEKIEKAASYFPHVLFVLAQVLSGTFLILLIGPLLRFCVIGNLQFTHLLQSFPEFWKTILAGKSILNIILWTGLAFPIGICFAEFFYRFGRLSGYINDLNLEEDRRDASKAEQIDLFKWKCRLQMNPWLSRIWEWENFQSNFFLYAEGISLMFVVLITVCTCIILIMNGLQGEIRAFICTIVLLIGSVLFFIAMRRARISKYESFRLAHKAIKELLKETENM